VCELAELRDDSPHGPAARVLFQEYLGFLRERLGLPPNTVPPAHVFGSEDAFGGEGAAWLVIFDAAGEPIACGGLRVLEPGVGEIKRMYVRASARGAGHGRRLLRELEARAAAAALPRLRLMTTELLGEARALYAGAGYREVERVQCAGEPVEIWLEKVLYS
jgi:GNAT superfamily N-acetyltransferase